MGNEKMFNNTRMCLVKEPEVGQWFWCYTTNKPCVMCEDMKFRVFGDITNTEYDFESRMLFNIDFGYYDTEPDQYRVGDVVHKDGKRYYISRIAVNENYLGENKYRLESMDDDEELDIDAYDNSYSHYPFNSEVREFKNKFNIPNWEFEPKHSPVGKHFNLKFNPDEFNIGEAYSITSPSICFHALLMYVNEDKIRFIRIRDGLPIEFTMVPDMVKHYNVEMRLLKDDFNSI